MATSVRNTAKLRDKGDTIAVKTLFDAVVNDLGTVSTAAVKVDLDAIRADAVLNKADLDALRVVVAALKVDVTTLQAWSATLIAKLNLDAGVTDTNYVASGAITTGTIGAITTGNPAAITTVASSGTGGTLVS